MALQDILKEVEERSSAEREAIQKDFDNKKSEAQASASKETERLKQEYGKKTSDETASLERRERDLTELDAKRIVERKKNDLITAEASRAAELVRKADSLMKREDLLELMVSACRKRMGDGIRIRCSPANEKMLKGKAGDIKPDLPESENGIICTSTDGKLELNLTMEFILKDVHEEILDGISRKASVV